VHSDHLLHSQAQGRRRPCPVPENAETSGGTVAPSYRSPGLYDSSYEHDACGVALVADLHGRRDHTVVRHGLTALRRLDHRGARGAEPNTGDGAGIMLQIPDAYLREVAEIGRASCRERGWKAGGGGVMRKRTMIAGGATQTEA